jgi:HAD superfamily hydrolase (TIGR01509 family)
MIKACLFDLDGTLLPLDTESFVRIYLKELAGKVKHLIAPDQLIQTIWEATEAMMKSGDGTRTNEQIFEREFLKRSGLDREIIWPLFNQFYEQDFPKLSKYTKVSPLSRKVVQAAVDQGYKVVVATNPVFPKAAIMERLKWAGIDDLPFQWVTVYEEAHYCKPNPEYYLEVAARIGVRPEECVMIGNDMQEDMVASTTGMKTFYLKSEYQIDRGKPTYPVDDAGDLQSLLESIQQQTGVFEKRDFEPSIR